MNLCKTALAKRQFRASLAHAIGTQWRMGWRCELK